MPDRQRNRQRRQRVGQGHKCCLYSPCDTVPLQETFSVCPREAKDGLRPPADRDPDVAVDHWNTT